MAATSAIFKGTLTKLLTSAGLGLEAGQKIKYTDGAAVGSIPVSDVNGVLSLTAWSAINTGLTTGSVVFIGASGVLAQNNASFFWNNSDAWLGLGTDAPLAKLHAAGGTDEIKIIAQAGVGQTLKVQEWRDEGGNPIASVGASGQAKFSGLNLGIRSINTNTTLVVNDYTVLVDASGGAITVTLPAAGGEYGRVYVIKKTDSSANTVTIDANASETIDGQLTQVISSQYSFIKIQSSGINWQIIG